MSDTKHPVAVNGDWIMHYTNYDGYKAISSQKDWTFKASQPKGNNKFGTYFTTLPPDAHRFSARVRVSTEKQEQVFAFTGMQELQPKPGGKGTYIFWTPHNYVVTHSDDIKSKRQMYDGKAETLP